MKIVLFFVLLCICACTATDLVLPEYKYPSTIVPFEYNNYIQCPSLVTSTLVSFDTEEKRKDWKAAAPRIANSNVVFYMKHTSTHDLVVCSFSGNSPILGSYMTIFKNEPAYFTFEKESRCVFEKDGNNNIAWCSSPPSHGVFDLYAINNIKLTHHQKEPQQSCPFIRMAEVSMLITIIAEIVVFIVHVLRKAITYTWYVIEAAAICLLVIVAILTYATIGHFTEVPRIQPSPEEEEEEEGEEKKEEPEDFN